MSYMQQLESKLKGMLIAFASGDLSAEDVIKSVKQTVLESYRNGQEAGPRQSHEPYEEESGERGTSPAATPQAQWNNKRSGGAPPPRRSYYKSIDTNRLRR
jgi:hypothetical protein